MLKRKRREKCHRNQRKQIVKQSMKNLKSNRAKFCHRLHELYHPREGRGIKQEIGKDKKRLKGSNKSRNSVKWRGRGKIVKYNLSSSYSNSNESPHEWILSVSQKTKLLLLKSFWKPEKTFTFQVTKCVRSLNTWPA